MAEFSENEERNKAMQRKMQALQIEQQKRNAVRRLMTIGAYERLMNVRVSNYELYTQMVDLIISLAQANKLQGQLNEEQLRDILQRITFRPESKIEFKHK